MQGFGQDNLWPSLRSPNNFGVVLTNFSSSFTKGARSLLIDDTNCSHLRCEMCAYVLPIGIVAVDAASHSSALDILSTSSRKAVTRARESRTKVWILDYSLSIFFAIGEARTSITLPILEILVAGTDNDSVFSSFACVTHSTCTSWFVRLLWPSPSEKQGLAMYM